MTQRQPNAMQNTRPIADIYPDRAAELSRIVGPAFGRCLSLFTSYADMSRATGVPQSTISHMMKGRNPDVEITRLRQERNCELYLDNLQSHEPSPQKNLALPAPEPASNGMFLVSVPSAKAAKFRAVCEMMGLSVVDMDD